MGERKKIGYERKRTDPLGSTITRVKQETLPHPKGEESRDVVCCPKTTSSWIPQRLCSADLFPATGGKWFRDQHQM